MIRLPKDLREFIASLNSNRIDYVVVGGYALALHGHPRFTGDIDVLIRASAENAARMERILVEFGFGSLGLTAADFLSEHQIVQLGHPPNRIDILTSISGVSFDEVWNGKLTTDLDGLPVHYIGRDSLIKNKRAVGRLQDRADIEALGEP
jgi:hypothetical protein